jgi:hypothetical protein
MTTQNDSSSAAYEPLRNPHMAFLLNHAPRSVEHTHLATAGDELAEVIRLVGSHRFRALGDPDLAQRAQRALLAWDEAHR